MISQNNLGDFMATGIAGQFSAGTIRETVECDKMKGEITHWHIGFKPSKELISTVTGVVVGALLSNDCNTRFLLSALGGLVGYTLSSEIFQQSATYIQNNYIYNINVVAVPKGPKATD